MPRFMEYDYGQTKLLPVSFERQILPGTFEYTLAYLVDNELDLTVFNHRYKNDEEGRPAYDPAILLKIILLAYSRGITSSRKIERLCRENVTFMALCADSQPHFTTISDFISSCTQEITQLFLQVLMVCDAEGLIGREMFAIDGVKLPSNASKEWSGTHADLSKKKRKLDRAVRRILKAHREADQNSLDEDMMERAREQCRKLRRTSRKISRFLEDHTERKGVSGRVVQSNITDNESAKMKTSHGVIQGYTGVAAVDTKHQVIVGAKAYGQGQEHGLLEPSIEQAHANLNHSEKQKRTVKITADSGYHNETALKYLHENRIDGYIADTGFRARDPRFKDYKAHKPEDRLKPKKRFTLEDFKVDMKKRTSTCPAGKAMWLKADKARIGHHLFMQFQAYEHDCPACALKSKCLKNESQKTPRQLNIKVGITGQRKAGLIEKMKAKIDSPKGRATYSLRLGTVEPVFGNITEMIGIKRFSLRGKEKVNAQWQLMAMIHNLFKIHRYAEGYS
jgi:transposase/C4-type Zn-finger protein